jgi:predicted Zn-dependent protease
MFYSAQRGSIGVILAIIAFATLAGAGIYTYLKTQAVSSKPSIEAISNASIPTASTPSQMSGKSSIHKSNNLKIEILVPKEYTIEEKFNNIDLTLGEELINVSKISTNFNSLEDYINNLRDKNNTNFTDTQKLTINGFEALKTNFTDPNNISNTQYVYYIYTNSRVYSLSTSAEQLHKDLDQIAQSFKYTP